ncbi:MAG: LamG-like jellyroll fold domain-containing protein, partial [Planctomycetota bacterium]
MCKKLIHLVSFVLMISQACNAVEIARWDFEETSGTTATDGSGQYVATLEGSDTLDVEGRFGSGIDFAGDGGATVDASGSEAFRFTGDFSVVLWVTSDVEWGAHTRFVDISAADGGLADSYRLFTHSGDNTDNFKFMSRQDGSNTQNIHTRDLPVGTWIMLVLRHDLDGDVTMNVLQDGDSVDEAFVAANSESWPTAGPIVYADAELKLGRLNGTGRKFDGKMDGIAFYDEVLNDAQVATLFYSAGSSEYPLASGPDPANGATLEATWVNLGWRAGDYAISHDLYFGTSFDDVNDGTEGTFAGNVATTSQVVGFPGFPAPDGLQPGTTYYWRVDEVNDANVASPWKGDVWSFSIPPQTAYNNSPTDGSTNVLQGTTLSWTPGMGASLHHVYFGESLDEVSNATGAIPQVDAIFTPTALETEKTYYWRVDEFDSAGAVHRGDVWSFATVPDVAVTNPNLTLWWTLDAGEGAAAAVDQSGHGNHGAI